MPKRKKLQLVSLFSNHVLVGAVLVYLRGNEAAQGFARACSLFWHYLSDRPPLTQAIWQHWHRLESSGHELMPGRIKCWKEEYARLFSRHSLACARWSCIKSGPVPRQGSAGCALPNGEFALFGGWTVEGIGRRLYILQRHAQAGSTSPKWVWSNGVVPRYEARRQCTYGKHIYDSIELI